MIEFFPLSKEIGAEVRGLDARQPIGLAAAAALRSGLDEHQLLCVRGQQGITAEQHIDFVGVFGPVADEHLDGERFTWVSNKCKGKSAAAGENELFWHSDYTFTPWPLLAISLYAKEIVGDVAPTRFTSTRRAWQALAPELKAELVRWRGFHMANFSGDGSTYNRQIDKTDPDPILFPHARHPICLTHPRTGAPLLFVNEYLTTRIEEVTPKDGAFTADGAAKLQEAFKTLYDPSFLYHHQWQEGDLVIWDNLSLQHGRRAFAPPAGSASPTRTLRRVVVSEHYNDIFEFAPRLKSAMTQFANVATFRG